MKRKRLMIISIVVLFIGGCSKNTTKIRMEDLSVFINGSGFIHKIEKKTISEVIPESYCSIIYGSKEYRLKNPKILKKTPDKVEYSYVLDSVKLSASIEYSTQKTGDTGDIVLSADIKITGLQEPSEDVIVKLAYPMFIKDGIVWLPSRDGSEGKLDSNEIARYHFAGTTPDSGKYLALPLISWPSKDIGLSIAFMSDPYFSVQFSEKGISWKYLKGVATDKDSEKRSLKWVFYKDDEKIKEKKADKAMQCFYKYMIPEIKPGSEWLHDIAMVNYDYMSDGGKGWYNDIDALAEAIPEEDRNKILLALHGWYDHVGQYCLDTKTGKLIEKWIVFSNYEKVKGKKPLYDLDGVNVDVGFNECRPVEMSLDEIHRRVDYAKSKGFKIGIYYSDGTNAGDGLSNYQPQRELYTGGWVGPDTKGKVYCQNPLNPEVYHFYITYIHALLEEFGGNADAFIWDESFMVRISDIGKEPYGGYAARAMMRMMRDVVLEVQKYNDANKKQIAFLASDNINFPKANFWAPYAIMSHGTFQDSHCRPDMWSYAIYPNYRNVVWSCCWWPISRWDWVEMGVKKYQAPVAISNGWGDNKGFSEMSQDMQKKVLDLFNHRKTFRTNLKPIN